MGSNKFSISTFNSFRSPIVHYKKRLYNEEGELFRINESGPDPFTRGETVHSININSLRIADQPERPLRDITEKIKIQLIPSWLDKSGFYNEAQDVLFNNETINEVLKLHVRLICPKLNYVISTTTFPLFNVDEETPLIFDNIVLDDLVDKIKIESEIIRVKAANPSKTAKAFSSLTILGRNNDINFFIDEVEEIGRNALEILPGDTGNLLFRLENIQPLTVDPPTLIYNKNFKAYFSNGDEYEIVQTFLLLIGQAYSEALLKWIIYGRPNYEDEIHHGIIRFLSEICQTNEKEFKDIIEDPDIDKKQDFYLKCSHTLFENIQTLNKGWNYFFKKFIENE